ncbi:MAG TPA: DNRLRE domain-containing protein [Gammaproteobacteria bacterium]|nr:DNRLRE domain-containing protein [Gammaproteobacteria bacterium]
MKTPGCRGTGFVLLPVILALALLSLVAALLLERGGTGGATAEARQQSDALGYAAEGGFRHAQALLETAGCLGAGVVPATPLGEHSYSAVMAGTGASAPATTYKLTAVDDTWIDENDKNVDHGNGSVLKNLRDGGKDRRSLLRFDLSTVPPDFDVATASLRLYVKGKDDSGQPVEIFRVTDTWTESSANWNNTAGDHDSGTVHGSFVPSQDGYLNVALTPLARQWVAGKFPNHGIVLKSTSNNKESQYASSEDSSSVRPQLTIAGRPNAFYDITATASEAEGLTRTLARTIEGPAGSALFLDYFDAGYAGNDGTRDFSGTWQESTESDGPGSGGLSVVADSKCAYGNCLKLDPISLLGDVAIWRELGLAGAASASLRLHSRRQNGNLKLEVSGNGGGSWQTLKDVGGSNDSRQVRDVFDISAYAGPNTRIRISSTVLVGTGSRYALVDDLEVEATCGP